jgi:hypothetical protein
MNLSTNRFSTKRGTNPPIVTCLILSAILTLLLWLFRK